MFVKFQKVLPFLFKKILIPFIIIAPISIVIALVIAEKMVQYANPQLTYKVARLESLRVYKKSDFLPFELLPNVNRVHIGNTHEFSYTVRTNSLGYRMNEFSQVKADDEFRILMLGDSMTFGYGVEVEDNFPSKLETKLNKYLKLNGVESKKVKIINAGFADGKSPDTYYLYLKKVGLDLNPDLIIVNYFINNDVADLDDTVWEKVDEQGLPEKIVSRTTYIDDDYTRLKNAYQNWKFSIPVLRDSNLWILFSTALESKSPETVIRIKKFLNVGDIPLIKEGEVFSCLFDSKCNDKMNDLLAKFFKVGNATYEVAKAKGVPIIFSALPANPQIESINKLPVDSSAAEGISFDEIIQNRGEFLKGVEPQSRIKTNLDLKDTEFIDPLPYLVDVDWHVFYFPKDGHATEKGNERLSLAYFDFLKNQWNLESRL